MLSKRQLLFLMALNFGALGLGMQDAGAKFPQDRIKQECKETEKKCIGQGPQEKPDCWAWINKGSTYKVGGGLDKPSEDYVDMVDRFNQAFYKCDKLKAQGAGVACESAEYTCKR